MRFYSRHSKLVYSFVEHATCNILFTPEIYLSHLVLIKIHFFPCAAASRIEELLLIVNDV